MNAFAQALETALAQGPVVKGKQLHKKPIAPTKLTLVDTTPAKTAEPKVSKPDEPPISRALRLEGPIAEIKIPHGAKSGQAKDEKTGEDVHFLQFCRPVKGGLVNIYLRGATASRYAGKTVVARVRVWEKTIKRADGSMAAFLFVDLHPLKTANATPDHRLAISDGNHRPKKLAAGEGYYILTPAPLLGTIALKPLSPKA